MRYLCRPRTRRPAGVPPGGRRPRRPGAPPDGHVVADLRWRQVGVAADAGEALVGRARRQGPRRCRARPSRVPWHSGAARPGPDRGRRGRGRPGALGEAHLPGERHRPAAGHRLGTEEPLPARPPPVPGQQLAADPAEASSTVTRAPRSSLRRDSRPDDDDLPRARTG
ncbi:hypothetical protein SAFG77S_08173 [Streptomyces afghaniensis]